MLSLKDLENRHIPEHIAIIMDGNGRWAKSRNLERAEGHREGVTAVRKTVEAADEAGVKYLTLYAFSTENWNRPSEEVEALMELMVYAITREIESLKKNDVKLTVIGDIDRLPSKTRSVLLNCVEETSNGKGLNMVLALSYSSRWEITDALKRMSLDVKNGSLNENDITEEKVSEYLTTKSMPDPDLLIRTGGELRISNFMLWQLAYTELYFTDTYWPDFGQEELFKAILEYNNRERRFGKISEQLNSEE